MRDAFPFELSYLNLQHYRARAHWDGWRRTACSDVRPLSLLFDVDSVGGRVHFADRPFALPDHVIALGDSGRVSLNFGDLRGSAR